MAKPRSPRKLAQRLALIANDIRATHGDLLAQTAPYALLLRQWEPSVDVTPLLGDLTGLEPIEPLDADAVREYYDAQGKDPSIYFYEEFLRAYDPASKRGRGVLYTPPEVVACMVRGVEAILLTRFEKAFDDALVIDPCCGVGTFLRHIESRSELHPKLIGMELMPAPCAIAKCLLRDTGVVQGDWLTQGALDTNGKLPVIIGNPPYSGHSSNAGKIADLMADYREGLDERNPKWLQDDYVKFIRMAQRQIDVAGRGVVALITNHSFLFNPTFRAMRKSLLRTFDEMFLLDLGGNVKQLDLGNENVFPIQMGVAISFMVRNPGSRNCLVRHAEIRGSRADKLTALSVANLDSMGWTDVGQSSAFGLLTPHDGCLREEFYGFAPLFDIFSESSVGFVTSRDAFAVGFTSDEVLDRIAVLRNGKVSNQVLRDEYRVGNLDIESARRLLQADPNWEDRVVEVLYRPFDRRWACLSRVIMERPRLPFMGCLLQENVALAIGRAGQVTGSGEWDVVFCTDGPADLNLFRRGGAKLFPRYVYHDGERLSNMHARGLDGDAVFGYIYAVLHSGTYRTRYAEMLRIDYPRIPMPRESGELDRLARVGWELIESHLLRTPPHSSPASASIRIGGYDVPRKCLSDRAGVDSEEQVALIKSAAERTRILRERVDEIVAESPPWQL